MYTKVEFASKASNFCIHMFDSSSDCLTRVSIAVVFCLMADSIASARKSCFNEAGRISLCMSVRFVMRIISRIASFVSFSGSILHL